MNSRITRAFIKSYRYRRLSQSPSTTVGKAPAGMQECEGKASLPLVRGQAWTCLVQTSGSIVHRSREKKASTGSPRPLRLAPSDHASDRTIHESDRECNRSDARQCKTAFVADSYPTDDRSASKIVNLLYYRMLTTTPEPRIANTLLLHEGAVCRPLYIMR